MRMGYRAWLEQQQYAPNTINTQCSHVSRLERKYGDLEALYIADGFASLKNELRYTSDDSRRARANPSKMDLGGDLYKQLASLRTAIARYGRFLDSVDGSVTPPTIEFPEPTSADRPGTFGLELDLQMSLRQQIASLEPSLTIIDDGSERIVESGEIDITARAADGTIVVIELKAGKARQTAVGQILSYMGDISAEEGVPVRGILIASGFDNKVCAAARVSPLLALRRYEVRFTFTEGAIDPGV